MDTNLIVGIIGMIFILIGFVLDEFVSQFNQNTIRYNVLNILGSLLLLYYAFTLKAWPFVVLNWVWLVAASIKLVNILRSR